MQIFFLMAGLRPHSLLAKGRNPSSFAPLRARSAMRKNLAHNRSSLCLMTT